MHDFDVLTALQKTHTPSWLACICSGPGRVHVSQVNQSHVADYANWATDSLLWELLPEQELLEATVHLCVIYGDW